MLESISLYVDPSDEAKKNGDPNHQAERRRQVKDLLDLYRNGSKHVQVDDAGDQPMDNVESQVRKKYEGQLQPYKDAVDEFNRVGKKVSDFIKTEGDRIAASVQKAGGSDDERTAAANLQTQFHQISERILRIQREMRTASEAMNPKWIDIVEGTPDTEGVKPAVDFVVKIIAFMGDPDNIKKLLKDNSLEAPSLLAYFTEASPRYKAMGAELKAYQDSMSKLESPKIQEVLSGLGRNCIVILGPDSAKVLTSWDLYDSKQTSPDGPAQSVFKGEEAISSALLSMVRPEKVKVVFVTASPNRITTDTSEPGYSDITQLLEQSNFEVLAWSPPSPPGPGQPPQPSDPPAQGKGVVWVVFPPEPPSMQMMQMGMGMPNAQGVIDAVQHHISEGGQVLFLAESGGANPMMPGTDYPYDALVKPFGINVMAKYTVVQQVEGEDRAGNRVTNLRPYLEIDRFEDDEITRPIQSLNTALFPSRAVTVVDVQKQPPAGVEAKVIMKTPYSSDYWGETNWSPDAKFDKDSDLQAPVPLAALAVKNRGKDNEQRIMVIGCKMIGANAVLEALQLARDGNQLRPISVFPGNQELVRNSILWLAGYENMIAVTPKTNANVRIGDVSPSTLAWIRFGVWVLAPVMALVLGGLIWFMRHR